MTYLHGWRTREEGVRAHVWSRPDAEGVSRCARCGLRSRESELGVRYWYRDPGAASGYVPECGRRVQ